MHSLWPARDLLAIMSVSEKIIGNSMKTSFIFCVKNGSGLFSYSPSPYSTVWRTCGDSAAAERSYSPSTSRLWDRHHRITYERPTWTKVYADLYTSSRPRQALAPQTVFIWDGYASCGWTPPRKRLRPHAFSIRSLFCHVAEHVFKERTLTHKDFTSILYFYYTQ